MHACQAGKPGELSVQLTAPQCPSRPTHNDITTTAVAECSAAPLEVDNAAVGPVAAAAAAQAAAAVRSARLEIEQAGLEYAHLQHQRQRLLLTAVEDVTDPIANTFVVLTHLL